MNDREYKYGLTETQYWFRAFVSVLLVLVALVLAALVAVVRMHGVAAVVFSVASLLFAGVIASGIGDVFDKWRSSR